MIQYWLFRLCALIWQRIPLSLGYRLASLVADITYLVWRKKRAFIIQNMTYVVGDKGGRREAERLARESLRNYCKYLVDFLRFPKLTNEDIERLVKFSGWEHFDRALQRGKGMIFIGVHMGNWDLGAAYVALRNYPLNAIAETFSDRKLNDYVQGTRASLGLKIIPMEQAARRIVRVLRQNEMLAILIDRPSPEDGVPVRFFGAAASVPAGAATLALRTGACVVPGCLVRLEDNTYLGIVEGHIEYDPVGDVKRDVEALTQKIMDSLEAMVRQYPDQWYMFRPMLGGEVATAAERTTAS